MKVIINGQIVVNKCILKNYAICYGKQITDIVLLDEVDLSLFEEVIDAKGQYIVPGFIDIHIHGYVGNDTMDGEVESLLDMATGVARNGVTVFLPTTMAMPGLHHREP